MLPDIHSSEQTSEIGEAKTKQARANRTREQTKRRLDEALEEGLKGTFPGSDPVAVIEPARERPDVRLDLSQAIASFQRQHATSPITSLVAGFGKIPTRSPQIRLEPRWAAACGAWFAVLLAMLCGLTDWRVAVMVTATAFMLARAGDMLDDH